MDQSFSFFSIKTQFENVGDALINRELIRLASTKSSAIVDVSRCPVEFSKTLEIGSSRVAYVNGTLKLFAKLLSKRLAGKRCYYYLSPGGYVGEKAGAQYYAAAFNTLVLRLLHLTGVKVCHVGVSYERIGDKHKSLLRKRSSLLYKHFVRDRESEEYARKIGLKVDGLMTDLAFGAVDEQAVPAEPRLKYAVSFRGDQSKDQHTGVIEFVKHLHDTVDAQIPFKFVCQVERDGSLLKNLAEELKGRDTELVSVYHDIDVCFNAYSDCKIIISNRLHALLIGMIAGCAPLAAVHPCYNQKIVGIFRDLGLENRVLDISGELVAESTAGLLASASLDPSLARSQKERLLSVASAIYD